MTDLFATIEPAANSNIARWQSEIVGLQDKIAAEVSRQQQHRPAAGR